jgi:hypothetical protein
MSPELKGCCYYYSLQPWSYPNSGVYSVVFMAFEDGQSYYIVDIIFREKQLYHGSIMSLTMPEESKAFAVFTKWLRDGRPEY